MSSTLEEEEERKESRTCTWPEAKVECVNDEDVLREEDILLVLGH